MGAHLNVRALTVTTECPPGEGSTDSIWQLVTKITNRFGDKDERVLITFIYFSQREKSGDRLTLEKSVLQRLKKGDTTYDELKKTFPDPALSWTLIHMEELSLVENRGGTWFITESGRRKVKRRRQMAYNLLIVPAVVFFLLSAQFYSGYMQAHDTNSQLLDEKAHKEKNLSEINAQEAALQTEYDRIRAELAAELAAEQKKTAELQTSKETAEASLEPLHNEISHYKCLETCTPDVFVTVDNPYVKAKVEEITEGLKTLRQKQEALFNFVRDDIEEDESLFHSGRLDFWEYPEDILKRGKGSYEDKYMLLLTMLRIAGTPPDDVRFVAADVDGNDNWFWIEAYDGETWWILDPVEGYSFTSTPMDAFYNSHEVKVLWWFNDETYSR